MINLLKSAAECDSLPGEVVLSSCHIAELIRVDVLDHANGMTDSVLTNTLVPFYSTTHSGTGRGLALLRVIIQARGGRITLSNREGGGFIRVDHFACLIGVNPFLPSRPMTF